VADRQQQAQVTSWISEMLYVLDQRRKKITELFDAFEGKHKLAYATPHWRAFHEDRYKGFSDNWCGVVGRAPVDRLHIKGFRLADSTKALSTAENQLWADWNRNEMGAASNQGFLSSIIAKRSAVLVWGDKDSNPVLSWEHPSQFVVVYDPETQRPIRALKWWADENREYCTLYLPDALWKFQRSASALVNNEGVTRSGIYVPTGAPISIGGWQPREVNNEPWPLPNPLGEVPLVEWTNRPLLGGQPISDIEGVLAMQHAINLMWAYLFVAADYASMPARIVRGEPPKVPVLDENGQVVSEKPADLQALAQGRLLFLPKADGIDSWEAAKLDVFTGVNTEAIEHIGAQTSTPAHYLINKGMANLNGDALTAAEVPLATKVGNQQLHFGPAAKRTARLMALVRGNKDTATQIIERDTDRFVQWKDPAMHSLAQVADAATKDRAVGLSLRTVLERRYEMTDEEIDREMDRIRDEQSDPFLMLDPVTAAAIKGAAGGGAGAAADSGAGA
jgi:hypothetical protein